MSRITHLNVLPKNIEYWDYYILCRLNDSAALALQRMEYWDGTKADGNIQGEQINDQIAATGKKPTQDISRFVYKSHDQLSWELMGTCSERTMPKTIDFILNDLLYLKWRSNPYNTFDRTKQYEFQENLVQSHLNKLYAIVTHFYELGRQESPVLYAIEQLTQDGFYIAQMEQQEDGTVIEKSDAELLTIERVAAQLRVMHTQALVDEEESKKPREKGRYMPLLPRFIQLCLKKDVSRGFSSASDTPVFPYSKIAVSSMTESVDSIRQNGSMDTAEMQDGYRKNAGIITITTTETTGNDYENLTTSLPEEQSSPFVDRSSQQGNASTHMGTQSSEHPAHSSRTPTQKGTSPSRTKKQPEPHQFTLTGSACLDALNAARTSPLTPKQVQENATHLEELALMIDTSSGKMLIRGIKTVWDYMGKDPFWCNKRSVPMFCKKFGDLYDVATSPVASKPSQNGSNGYHKPDAPPPSYEVIHNTKDPRVVALLRGDILDDDPDIFPGTGNKFTREKVYERNALYRDDVTTGVPRTHQERQQQGVLS